MLLPNVKQREVKIWATFNSYGKFYEMISVEKRNNFSLYRFYVTCRGRKRHEEKEKIVRIQQHKKPIKSESKLE